MRLGFVGRGGTGSHVLLTQDGAHIALYYALLVTVEGKMIVLLDQVAELLIVHFAIGDTHAFQRG